MSETPPLGIPKFEIEIALDDIKNLGGFLLCPRCLGTRLEPEVHKERHAVLIAMHCLVCDDSLRLIIRWGDNIGPFGPDATHKGIYFYIQS